MALSDIEKIVQLKPKGVSSEEWEHSVRMVHFLCELGEVTEWATHLSTAYKSMPRVYLIDDIAVEFLPHWPFYNVGPVLGLDVPTTKEEIMQAVAAVKTLKRLGWEPTDL